MNKNFLGIIYRESHVNVLQNNCYKEVWKNELTIDSIQMMVKIEVHMEKEHTLKYKCGKKDDWLMNAISQRWEKISRTKLIWKG